MNPYLTTRGRYVFASGILFVLVGILVGSPIVVVLGQIHVVVLVVAYLLNVPGALALDRRLVSLSVEPGESAGVGTGHVVGDQVAVALEVENRSTVPIHRLRAEPFGAEGLGVVDLPRVLSLGGRGRGEGEFNLRGGRFGRWMLHGFDVAISDPLALVEARDYLPAMHAFEFYPRAGRLRTRRRGGRRGPYGRQGGGQHLVEQIGAGTDVRELRDYQPGDSLRDIAWKSTVRHRKLIARDFEREVSQSVYVALDVSSSMRGGQWPGQKLEFAVELAVDRIEEVIGARDRVGLVSFDEKLYGHIAPGNSTAHYRRLLHHLVGLNSIVDPALTELDEPEVERLAADYLLVQERLDFRRGAPADQVSGVNVALLERWLRGVSAIDEERFASPTLRDGVVEPEVSRLRRFLSLRGVEIPYRVEARLGMKERGLVAALEQIVRVARGPQRIVVISDLCGIMKPDVIVRGVQLARASRHQVEFLVPFTPDFYQEGELGPKFEMVRELFTTAETEERMRIVARLRGAGVSVRFARPHAEPAGL